MPTWRHCAIFKRHELASASQAKLYIQNDKEMYKFASQDHVPKRETCQSVDMIGGLQSSVTQANGEVSADLMALSVISNCGDFQMARREMWQRATFSQSMIGQRLRQKPERLC